MIQINEAPAKKIPGETSLYVSFNYDENIIQAIKECAVYYYDKNSKTWEIPLTDIAEIITKLHTIDNIEYHGYNVPNSSHINYQLSPLRTELYPYQADGVQFGLNHNKWLLLDAPGLGKTLQIISLANELKNRAHIQHCLIICGINTLKINWEKEILKHSDLSCRILGQRQQKTTSKRIIGSVKDRVEDLKTTIDEFFVITNIETLRNDAIIKELTNGKNVFDMIVVDEIQACKNPQSQQGHHLLKLKHAKYKIGATGTILTNSPYDAYVPLKFIDAENANFSTFKKYYTILGGPFNQEFLGYRNTQVLKQQLSNNSLRRTKDILNLPGKNIINQFIELNDDQDIFYKNIKQGIKDQVDKIELNNSSVLALITRLRQATTAPSILTTENISSSKLDRAISLAEEIIQHNEKVVIFCAFKEAVYALYDKLKIYNAVVNTGDIDDNIINININKFQTDEQCKIFIATWQKCGTGITLTAASYMIFVDLPWTYSLYEQACDRIYRIGTQNLVFIYNLVCSNTIDEKILSIINDKQAITDFIVDDKVTNKSIDILRQYIIELQ